MDTPHSLRRATRRTSSTARRLAAALATFGFVAAAAAEPQPVRDPVPTVERGDLVVGVRVVAELPKLSDASNAIDGNQAHARIQNLVPAPDGSDAFFVNDMRGVLYRIRPARDGAPAAVTPYLDLREADVGFTNAAHANESGLAGFAFHPDFARAGRPGSGKLYVAYSAPTGSGRCDFLGDRNQSHESVVREWTARDPAAPRLEGESREILRVGQPGKNHNIGTIAFNPNVRPGDADYGMLYVSFGDGSAQYDPLRLGQPRTDTMGSLLRIDPQPGAAAGARYAVPKDNPFVNESGAAPLVWAYGLRHPQHFGWDTGGRRLLYIAEMGQDQIDEINIGVAGGNYGWSLREGTFATGMALGASIGPVYPRPERDERPFIYPVAQYDHDDGKAVGSVVVYRGAGVPALEGKLLCGDIVNGRIFYVDETSLELGRQTPLKALRLSFDGSERELRDVTRHSGDRVDLRLGRDGRGEVYLLTKSDGKIRQLVPAK